MKIENLKEGMVVKNYKEMCVLLDEKIKGGDSKKAQLKEWERYFKYHKDGNKFVIDEIYKEIKEKVDSRKEANVVKNINKGVYSKEIFPLVKNFVGKTDIEFHSKSSVMQDLKLKNENYDIAYENPKKASEFLTNELDMFITEEDIHMVLATMWNISQEKINKAFKNLERLEYIYDYTDKLLCIWNNESNKKEVVIDNYEEITKCIYEGKVKALANYYARNPKKTMDDYFEIMEILKDGKDMSLIEDIEKVSSKLNIELYLRGLGNEARKISLDMFKNNEKLSYIGSFYYAHAYIKNHDIEWDKEILEVAKEKIHIRNFKRAVKEEYMLNTFLDKWFKTENERIDNCRSSEAKKTLFREELAEHKKIMSEKIDLLFDIFIPENPSIIIKETTNKKDSINSELPF